MENIHPRNIHLFKQILALTQLKRMLQEDLPVYKETPFYFHHLKLERRSGIYCKFKGCHARLIYLRNDQNVFQLIEYNNVHNHPMKSKIAKFKIQEQSQSIGQLFMNQEMGTYYKKYYRCMYINFFTLKHNWHALVFSGVRHDQCVCVFALSVIDCILESKVKEIMKQMSNTDKKTETIIITNPDLLSPCQEIFPTATTILFEPMNCPRLKVRFNFSKLISETISEQEWESDRRRLAMELSEEMSIPEIKEYFNKYQHLCLPFLPKTFVGLGIQLMHPLVVYHALEEKAFIFSKVGVFYKNFPASIKIIHTDKETKEWISSLSSLFQEDSLFLLSERIEEQAFRHLIKQQNRAMYCNFSVNRDGTITVQHDSWAKVQITKVSDKYECECHLNTKTGLPCCHILKLLLFYGLEILPYIDQYWIIKTGKPKTKNNAPTPRKIRNHNRNQLKANLIQTED